MISQYLKSTHTYYWFSIYRVKTYIPDLLKNYAKQNIIAA
jgi:hypothetical protein